jgi:hemoglobin
MSRTSTLYAALGGTDGVLRLAEAWHQRVLADEIVAHAFSHGFHPQHTERLAAYWDEAWGGPTIAWATNTSMSRYHDDAADVPNGLRIPRWSWDGLQT